MKKIVALIIVNLLASASASAKTCSFQSTHISACGDGVMRITIEEGIGNSMFLFYHGDVICWNTPYSISGLLKDNGDESILIATINAGSKIRDKNLGRIRIEENRLLYFPPASGITENETLGLQQTSYELNCK